MHNYPQKMASYDHVNHLQPPRLKEWEATREFDDDSVLLDPEQTGLARLLHYILAQIIFK